jgi:hypothetical protein
MVRPDPKEIEAGTVAMVAERAVKFRIPRALEIKSALAAGGQLSGRDLGWLQQMLKDAQSLQPLVGKHPEWHEIATKMISLYSEIAEQALANEPSDQTKSKHPRD